MNSMIIFFVDLVLYCMEQH